jgi:hypothetical protein
MAERSAPLRGLVLITAFAVGCAGELKAPVEPSAGEPLSSAPDPHEQHDAGALETQLLDQEGVIVRELLPPATSGGAEAEAPGVASATPAPESPRAPPTACQTACKALGSMRRAAEGICRLTEDEPERCERARERVRRAAARVTDAGCVCSEPD